MEPGPSSSSSSSSPEPEKPAEPTYDFFDKTIEQFVVHYKPDFFFTSDKMDFTLSKPRYANLTHPGLQVELRRVDYASGIKYTVFWSSVLLVMQGVGLVMNMIQICKQRQLTEHTMAGVITFYINSNVLLSVESNRISMSNNMFDFVSFFCYYIKCLMIGLYIADVRARARNGEVEYYKGKIMVSSIFIVSILTQYCLSSDVESTVFSMALLPIAYQAIRSFIKARKNFSFGYTFLFKLSHITYLVFLLTLEAPHSLVPSNFKVAKQYLIFAAIIYSVILAQVLYHPKLWQKNKYLMAQLIYRPVRKQVKDLPEKEDGEKYSCIICMEDFNDEEEFGVHTHCNHFFHETCLEEWLKINHKCPICKRKVLPINSNNDL